MSGKGDAISYMPTVPLEALHPDSGRLAVRFAQLAIVQ
jgi:hypothetical protein